MWLYFDGGFVSIVEDRRTKDLLVRARDRTDLQTFRDLCGISKRIIETPMNDYRFRFRATSVEVTQGVAAVVARINYPNFKGRVAERQGHERARIYAAVWDSTNFIDHRRRRPL